jgi:hypothetical protein
MTTLRLLPELEQDLQRVPGVQAASVVTGPDAVPVEIHVLAAPTRAAKQIVRDIQSLAQARHGLAIDHRIVSVVQLDVDDTSPPPGPDTAKNGHQALEQQAPPRPAIASIMVRSAGPESEAVVVLAASGLTFEGRATGASGLMYRARLVARATLDALGELLGHSVEVDSADIVDAGPHRVAVTVLTILAARSGEQLVSGSAVVRSDEADAIARSVLDALNRRLAD